MNYQLTPSSTSCKPKVKRSEYRAFLRRKKSSPPIDILSRMLSDGYLHHVVPKYPLEDLVFVPPKVVCSRPDVVPLSEEVGVGVVRPRKSAVRKLDVRTIRKLCNDYLDHLGLRGCSITRKSPKDCHWEINKQGKWFPKTSTMHWNAVKGRKINEKDVGWMISGKDRVMARGFEKTRILTLDIDVHGKIDRQWQRDNWELKKDLHRGWIAANAWETVQAAIDTMPSGAVLVETTPNGFHVSMVLDRAVKAKRAARMVDDWRRTVVLRAGLGKKSTCGVEAFPKVNRKGIGYGCSLPGSAGQRVVDPDGGLMKPLYGRRVDDVRHLLRMPVVKVSTVEAILEGLPKEKLALRLVEGWEGEVLSPRGDTEGQVFKEAFVEEWLRLFNEGIRDDESWHAVRVLTAGCRYAGLSPRETMFFMRRFLRLGKHDATHCQSERGIRALMRTVKCQLRHFRRGLSVVDGAGRPMCYRNGMKSDELRSDLYDFMGMSVREHTHRPRAVLLRDQAA